MLPQDSQSTQTHETWDGPCSPDSREEFQKMFDCYWEKRYGLSQKTALFFMLTMVSSILVVDPPHNAYASIGTSIKLTIIAISIIIFNIKDSQKETCVCVAYFAVLTQIIFEDIGNANTCGGHNRFFTGYLIFLMFGNIFLHVKYKTYRKIVLASMIMWNIGMFLVLWESPLLNPILESYAGESDYFEMDVHKWFWSFMALCFVAMSCIQSTQKREISRRFMYIKILKDKQWFEKEKKRKLKKQRRKERKKAKQALERSRDLQLQGENINNNNNNNNNNENSNDNNKNDSQFGLLAVAIAGGNGSHITNASKSFNSDGRYSDDPDSSINGTNSDGNSSSSESDVVMDETLNAFTWHSNKGIGRTIDYITAVEHQMFSPPTLERDAGSKAANSSGNNSTKLTHVELKNENSDYKTNDFEPNPNTNYHIESEYKSTNTSHHRKKAVAETEMAATINLNTTLNNENNNNSNNNNNNSNNSANGRDDQQQNHHQRHKIGNSFHKRHSKHLDELVFRASALQLVKTQDIAESNVDNRFLRFFKLIGVASSHVTTKHDRHGSIVKENGGFDNAFNLKDIYELHGDAQDTDIALSAIKSIEINDNQASSPRWEEDLKRKYSTYCHLSQLPPWYEAYDWILEGYRYNNRNKTWTPLEATKSIFAFHNETGNIWTEFIPAILTIMLDFYYAHVYSDFWGVGLFNSLDTNVNIRIVSFCTWVAAIRCVASGLAHAYSFLDEKWSYVWWTIDYVSVVITLSYFAVCEIVLILYCYHVAAQFTVVYSMVVLCITITHAVCLPKNIEFRVLACGFISLEGIGSLYFYQLSQVLQENSIFNSHDFKTDVFITWTLSFVGFLLAALSKASEWPESIINKKRINDKKFNKCNFIDYIGTSHQLWHILVNGAVFLCIISLANYAKIRVRYDTCS